MPSRIERAFLRPLGQLDCSTILRQGKGSHEMWSNGKRVQTVLGQGGYQSLRNV